MSEEFATLLEEGQRGLGDRKTIRAYLQSLAKNPDGSLLINYLENNDVGELISTDDSKAKDLTSPLLARDEAENKIKLQPYLSTLSNNEAGKEIISRLQTKYPGFVSIPVEARKEMVRKLVENYGVKMTKPAESSIGTNLADRRQMKRHLGIFANKKTGNELTEYILSRPVIDTKKIMIDSDTSRSDKEAALKYFKSHSKSEKLLPLIVMLEGSMGQGDRISQPSYVLQDFISRGDLRFTKNREKIYEYWEGVASKYDGLVEAHNEFKKILNLAFPAEERNAPQNEGLKNLELYKYIDKFNEADVSKLKYVFEFMPVNAMTVDSKDKGLEALDEFLDAVGESPPERQTKLPKATPKQTGYRQSEEQGGGQVGEMDTGDYGDTIIENERRIERLRDLIQDNIIDIKLDPLYAYAQKQGSSGFRVTPAMARDFRKMKTRMRKYAIRLKLDKSALREVERYMNDLEMKSVISGGDFYLPYQEDLIETIDTETKGGVEIKTNFREIKDYLDNVSSFIQAGQEAERGTGLGISAGEGKIKATKKDEKIRDERTQQAVSGRGVALPSKRSMRSQLQSLRVEVKVEVMDKNNKPRMKTVDLNSYFEALQDAIEEYFVNPASSSLKPLSRRFDWMDTTTLTILGSKRVNSNAFLTMLSLQRSNIGGILLDEPNMDSVVGILTALSKPVSKQTVDTFMEMLKNAALAVDEVFKGDDSRGVSIEFGNLGYTILSKNSLDTDREFGIGTEKKLKQWSEDYKKSPGTIYPFAALYAHILSNENTYRSYGGSYPNLIDEVKRIETKLDIIKSDMEIKYLTAHDTIRKMMNKPLYYGLSSTSDFDDVQETISLMKSKFNTDLTAMEIEGIVSDLDSMQNLSNRYGISTEEVYYLKAIHR